MNEFRLLLLVLAIAVFVGTLLWSRFNRDSKGRNLFSEDQYDSKSLGKDVLFADESLKIEEDFGVSEVRIIKPEEATSTRINPELHNEDEIDQDDTKNKNSLETDSQYIAVLHVTALGGEQFSSKKICKVLEHLGLRHGKYKIYHRESLQNSDLSLFSVANMVKPGFFEPEAEESFKTPGISFFLVLPGPTDPITTFNEMVQTARQVAQTLGGELLDADRSTYTSQRGQLIRDEIASFLLRLDEE